MGHKIVYNKCYGGYGLSDKAVEMLNRRGYNYDKYDMCYNIPRHNKDLVEIVETLGEESWGFCSKLGILELPEDCNMYRITEYDGLEEVEFPDTIDWILVSE